MGAWCTSRRATSCSSASCFTTRTTPIPPDVVVSIPLPRSISDCWKIVARARSTSLPQVDVRTSPVFIVGAKGEKLALQPVPGSTVLYSEDAKLIADLPDGVSAGEVQIPVAVPAGKALFVNFRAAVK
jgi:hypothetical protein